ncbi:MAG: hypothetical protein ICV83_03945 [Cytophagales bacterium]|nr:hypothetical protein [Cytophagales bacterium]
MTTFPKVLRFTRTANHPENRGRCYYPETGPHSREPWPPEPNPPEPKASLGRFFELLSLYK